MKTAFHTRKGFTLVEMLVSVAIVVLLLTIMLSMITATRNTWTFTRSRIEQFQDSREAFESITRRLSQATLNTYWDYVYANGTNNAPTGYERQSELRFVSGASSQLLQNTNNGALDFPTHSVFFQAPLGFVTSGTYSQLKGLLNTWGYFVQFGSDASLRPPFINSMTNGNQQSTNQPALRYRFRLMELMQPSESLTVYKYTNGETVYSGGGISNTYNGQSWYINPLNFALSAQQSQNGQGTGTDPAYTRVLAENIVALIILPKLAPDQIASLNQNGASSQVTDTSLVSPNNPDHYLYDSSNGTIGGGNDMGQNITIPYLDPLNQLPPVVQVTLVAVDEPTYSRFQKTQTDPTAMPTSLGLTNLFQNAGTSSAVTTGQSYTSDLNTLETTLQNHSINYRVYSTNVSIKDAKWSAVQSH